MSTLSAFDAFDIANSHACPVRCGFHRQAAFWLHAGSLDALRANLGRYTKMHKTVWRRCRCDLYGRIRKALNG